jgi:hypothetical protein
MNTTKLKARVAAETLSDGSMAFNVLVGNEEVAWPPTLEEAQGLCAEYNQRHEMADVQHEEVMLSCVKLSCVKRDYNGTPIEVLTEIHGQVLIGGKFYTIGQHCWLNLNAKP